MERIVAIPAEEAAVECDDCGRGLTWQEIPGGAGLLACPDCDVPEEG